MIRTFNLKNSKNEVYTLAVANKHTGFLYDVSGLGMEHTAEYQQLGNTFEALTDNINQAVISGTVLFFNPYAYQEYLRFAAFCQDKNLKMHYRTPAGEFWRDGSVTKIEKSENNDSLKVHIDFTTTSLWYKEIEVDSDSNELTFISDSDIDSPCILTLTTNWGSVTAVEWYQKVDNVTVMTGELSSLSLSQYDQVIIRTDTNPYKIYKSGGMNLYGKSNFSTKRFPFLKKGENTFHFSISPSPPAPPPPEPAPVIGTINLKAFINYETV